MEEGSVHRIRIQFDPALLNETAREQGLDKSWHRLSGNDIRGLAQELIAAFSLTERKPEALKLAVDGFTLPALAPVSLLKEGDTLCVSRVSSKRDDDRKRSRSARRKSAMRARRRQANAVVGRANGKPVHVATTRTTAAADDSSPESGSSDDDRDKATKTPSLRSAVDQFLAWARGSAVPMQPSVSLSGRFAQKGDVLCFRVVELARRGVPRLSPYRACEVIHVSGDDLTVAPWPPSARMQAENLLEEMLDEEDVVPGVPFDNKGVAVLNQAKLVEIACTVLVRGSAQSTEEQFKAAAAALSAHRRAAAASVEADVNAGAAPARSRANGQRRGVGGVGGVLRHLRAQGGREVT